MKSLLFVLGLCVVAQVIYFFIPVVHAQSKPHFQAKNNHEACLDFKENGAELRGASTNQLKELCKKEGVILN